MPAGTKAAAVAGKDVAKKDLVQMSAKEAVRTKHFNKGINRLTVELNGEHKV